MQSLPTCEEMSDKNLIFAPIVFIYLALLSTPLRAAIQQSAVVAGAVAQGDTKIKADDVVNDTLGHPVKPIEGLHVDVDLALVNVTVTDPYDRVVTGLEPDNFRVFEDNVEQEVHTHEVPQDDVPPAGLLQRLPRGSAFQRPGRRRDW